MLRLTCILIALLLVSCASFSARVTTPQSDETYQYVRIGNTDIQNFYAQKGDVVISFGRVTSEHEIAEIIQQLTQIAAAAPESPVGMLMRGLLGAGNPEQ